MVKGEPQIAPAQTGPLEKLEVAVESLVQGFVKSVVADGKSIYDGIRHYVAGDVIEMSSVEADAFRAKGFLVDPNAPAAPVGDGPVFEATDGPSVKPAS